MEGQLAEWGAFSRFSETATALNMDYFTNI
jgi:hypothetical protein